MEPPLTRDQLIDAGITSPSSHRATCPCGTELSQGGIPWGTCRDCAEEVCGKCAASVSDEERPVFVCRKCAGKCLDCGGDVFVVHHAGAVSVVCDCGFAVHLTRTGTISAVYTKAGKQAMRCSCPRHETPGTAGMYMAAFDPFGYPVNAGVTVRIRAQAPYVTVIMSVGAFHVDATSPCVVEALHRVWMRYEGAIRGAIHAEELRRLHFPQLLRPASVY